MPPIALKLLLDDSFFGLLGVGANEPLMNKAAPVKPLPARCELTFFILACFEEALEFFVFIEAVSLLSARFGSDTVNRLATSVLGFRAFDSGVPGFEIFLARLILEVVLVILSTEVVGVNVGAPSDLSPGPGLRGVVSVGVSALRNSSLKLANS